MNDTLRYMRHDPVHRKYHQDELTFSLIYAFTENFVLPLLARRSGARQGLAARPDARRPVAEVRQPAAAVRLHVRPSPARSCCSWAANSASGTSGTTTPACNGTCCSGRAHQGLQKYVADLNHLYRREPALHEVDFDYTRLRVDRLPQLGTEHAGLRAAGQGPERLHGRRLQLHAGAAHDAPPGRARAVLVRRDLQQRLDVLRRQQPGQRPGRMAEQLPWDGRPYSIPITLPPLGVVMLKPRR